MKENSVRKKIVGRLLCYEGKQMRFGEEKMYADEVSGRKKKEEEEGGRVM